MFLSTEKKCRHPTIKRISDLNSNGQVPESGDKRNFDTQQDLQE